VNRRRDWTPVGSQPLDYDVMRVKTPGHISDARLHYSRIFARGETLDVMCARGGRGFQRLYRRFDSVLHSWRNSQTAADIRGARGGQLLRKYLYALAVVNLSGIRWITEAVFFRRFFVTFDVAPKCCLRTFAHFACSLHSEAEHTATTPLLPGSVLRSSFLRSRSAPCVPLPRRQCLCA
jgi:hypothetical protein